MGTGVRRFPLLARDLAKPNLRRGCESKASVMCTHVHVLKGGFALVGDSSPSGHRIDNEMPRGELGVTLVPLKEGVNLLAREQPLGSDKGAVITGRPRVLAYPCHVCSVIITSLLVPGEESAG